MSQPEYRWRQLTPKQRAELLAWRQERGQPWHSPYEVVVTGGALRVSSEHSEAKWVEARAVSSLDLAPTVKGFLMNGS